MCHFDSETIANTSSCREELVCTRRTCVLFHIVPAFGFLACLIIFALFPKCLSADSLTVMLIKIRFSTSRYPYTMPKRDPILGVVIFFLGGLVSNFVYLSMLTHNFPFSKNENVFGGSFRKASLIVE